MSDDFFSLKMLIVSEAAPERELLRQAAAQASIPIDVSELEAAGDPDRDGRIARARKLRRGVFRFPDSKAGAAGIARRDPRRAQPSAGRSDRRRGDEDPRGSDRRARGRQRARQADRPAGDARPDRPLHPRPAAQAGSDRRRFVHGALGHSQGAAGQPVQARGRGGGGWIGRDRACEKAALRHRVPGLPDAGHRRLRHARPSSSALIRT